MEKNKEEIIKNAISQAEKVVKESGVVDEELKKIAFSKAVDYFTQNNNDVKQGVLTTSKLTTDTQQSPSDGQGFWENLAQATGFDGKKLKDVYVLKNDNQVLLVIPAIKGNTLVEQRRNLAALILLAYQEGLRKEWTQSNLLAESAKHSNLYSLSKFAKSLKSSWFRVEGQKKGVKYKLSSLGLIEANKYLAELLNI